MNQQELLDTAQVMACPFCGKPPAVKEKPVEHDFLIECQTQDCVRPYTAAFSTWSGTRKEAIKRWNRREN